MTANAIVVTGDFVLDHHIYEGTRHHYGDSTRDGVRVKTQLGGASLVHDILSSLLSGAESDWRSHLAVTLPKKNDTKLGLSQSEQAFAFWRPYPKKTSPDRQFWRVSEAMGFGHEEKDQQCDKLPPAAELPPNPRIMVLSEGGMGFRACSGNWNQDKLAKAQWVILKTASPIGEGKLWEYVTSEEIKNKLIVIADAQHLRKSPARISAGLAWEESIENVIREIKTDGALNGLTQCRHLIVTFGSEGALWIDFSQNTAEGRLPPAARVDFVFSSSAIEGEHRQEIEGTSFGFLSCLTAAVAWQISLNTNKPDFTAAMEGGLSAMRDLREKGHGPANEAPDGFPAGRLAKVIKHPTFRYSRARIRIDEISKSPEGKSWSILRQAQQQNGPAYELARLLLLRGPVALENMPHLRVGKLLTADRREIEAFRTLIQVIRRYKETDPGKKPLSLGVFGPPGAGKSFAVQELSGKMVGKEGWMEFNLSQFNTPDDLIGAFHQIRDQVLHGRLPVAFFDEFDSQQYRWLQYLLAPMQDGKFQEGQLTHALGKCIFIFAGGTSRTFETFGPPEFLEGKESEAYGPFRLAKGPDFKSRLDGYLNVVGPNRRQVSAPEGSSNDVEMIGGYRFMDDLEDIHFPIRRALMIRAELKCGPDDKLDMDEGLVHALLHVERYTHGARSLGKIMQPFTTVRNGKLHRSLLMPQAQLAMHTNETSFVALLDQGRRPFLAGAPLTREQVAVIAPAIHETFRELGRKEGWLKDDIDKDFKALSDFFKRSNVAASERMLSILDLVGLRLEKGEFAEKDENIVKEYIEYHLEMLAEAEHDGWMAWHIGQGWRYHAVTDKKNQLHSCLRPYSQLKPVDIEKDRNTIRHYPDFARGAGLKIVFA